MSPTSPWCFVWLLLACGSDPVAANGVATGGGMAAERPLFEDARWDDGAAEVASYRAIERRYGTLREGIATLILVKETFDADLRVKDDGPDRARRTVEVLKLNHVLVIPTGVYEYRQMASVFLRRDDARLLKLVTSSQEWCGITHKRLSVDGGHAALHTSSYFGGEAERTFDLPVDEETVWFDALPAWLRTLDLADRRVRRVRLVNAQLHNRAEPPAIVRARITLGALRSVDVPAGRYEVVPVVVSHAGARDVFHLDAQAPHTLVRWDRSDGGVYELRWARRARYWEMHDLEHVGALEDGP